MTMRTMGHVFRSLIESELVSTITNQQAVDASNEAARSLSAAFNGAGFDTDVMPSDGWGISSVTVTMRGMRIPVMIGVQNFPKGLEMHVEFQSPISRSADWEEIGPELFNATKSSSGVFGGSGIRLKVGTKGKYKWPYVWIYPGSKGLEAVKSFPKKVESFSRAVVSRVSKHTGK